MPDGRQFPDLPVHRPGPEPTPTPPAGARPIIIGKHPCPARRPRLRRGVRPRATDDRGRDGPLRVGHAAAYRRRPETASRARPTADPTRAGGRGTDRAGPVQPADRHHAHDQPTDRRKPRREHPPQARLHLPDPDRDLGHTEPPGLGRCLSAAEPGGSSAGVTRTAGCWSGAAVATPPRPGPTAGPGWVPLPGTVRHRALRDRPERVRRLAGPAPALAAGPARAPRRYGATLRWYRG